MVARVLAVRSLNTRNAFWVITARPSYIYHGLQLASSWYCNSLKCMVCIVLNTFDRFNLHNLLFSHCHVRLFATLWTAAHQTLLSSTISQRLLKLMSIESVMPSNHLILCHLLLLLPSAFPRIRVFSSESALCIQWPKYWSFNFSISPSNEYSVLIAFRIDCSDLFTVQGTLKRLLQPWRECGPLSTLISDLQLLKLWENKFLLL